ncbi:unnamed protein product [Gongylonema pulchrum]|uniref:Uncharacterized protein n=1 Tax=Gongylonema pulchrum TaxID=637853 RepID=A0A3P7PGQ2_9BILA|nr:unnamed protein product [Gongylonema pulchrum]
MHSLHVWSLNMDKTALAVHLAVGWFASVYLRIR